MMLSAKSKKQRISLQEVSAELYILEESLGRGEGTATSAVPDVHATCKCHCLLSLLVTDEVKHILQ